LGAWRKTSLTTIPSLTGRAGWENHQFSVTVETPRSPRISQYVFAVRPDGLKGTSSPAWSTCVQSTTPCFNIVLPVATDVQRTALLVGLKDARGP
jgi:hypothetical protein